MMMGDSVTLASRLEGANKKYGTLILVSSSTYLEAKNVIEARELDVIRVKGRTEPVPVYELVARRGELRSEQIDLHERYARCLSLYRARDWVGARESFAALAERFPEDGPTREYLHRLSDLGWTEKLPSEWDGAYTLTEK
jgi:adenylate cyclase